MRFYNSKKIIVFTFILWLVSEAVLLAQGPVYTVTLATSEAHPDPIYFMANGNTIIGDNNNNILYQQNVGQFPNGIDWQRNGNKFAYYVLTSDFNDRPLGDGYYVEMDLDYTIVKTHSLVGYPTDLHEILLMDNGHTMLMSYYPFTVDTTAYGGFVTATVISCVLQEQDINGTPVWTWDSWHHMPLTTTNQPLDTAIIDYSHCNSAEIDHDGNVLVSHRHTDSVTKIDKTTGNILWHLGGVENNFVFTNDGGFALQHDARRLDNGRLTLFDNRTGTEGYSRGVEYEINETTMMITKTWEVTGPFAFCCGNMQTLSNGNRLIGWGPASPAVSEHKPDGTMVFAADVANISYRVRRAPFAPHPFQIRLPVIVKQ